MNIGITDEEFYKIMNYVKNHCGIDLNGKKTSGGRKIAESTDLIKP